MNEYVGNEQAMMAEFADNLWKNYIKPKYEATRQDKVSYYRATVISNNGDGTLTVRPACDNERTVNHTSELSNIEAGAEVVVWKLGNGNAAMNHLAVLTYSDGSTPSDEWGLDVLLGGANGSVQQNTVSAIRDYAAYHADGLKEIRATNVRIIGSGAFYRCDALSSISFPKCTHIGPGAFVYCSNLSSPLDFPVCESVGAYAFRECLVVSSANFPACSWIQTGAFSGCRLLTQISFPVCVNVEDRAFAGCFTLESANLPACEFIGSSAFQECSELRTASLPVCSWIESSAFNRCVNFTALYLTRVANVTALRNYALSSTPIGGYSEVAGRYGSVYVPSSLHSRFVVATNWASISSRIVAV